MLCCGQTTPETDVAALTTWGNTEEGSSDVRSTIDITVAYKRQVNHLTCCRAGTPSLVSPPPLIWCEPAPTHRGCLFLSIDQSQRQTQQPIREGRSQPPITDRRNHREPITTSGTWYFFWEDLAHLWCSPVGPGLPRPGPTSGTAPGPDHWTGNWSVRNHINKHMVT